MAGSYSWKVKLSHVVIAEKSRDYHTKVIVGSRKPFFLGSGLCSVMKNLKEYENRWQSLANHGLFGTVKFVDTGTTIFSVLKAWVITNAGRSSSGHLCNATFIGDFFSPKSWAGIFMTIQGCAPGFNSSTLVYSM